MSVSTVFQLRAAGHRALELVLKEVRATPLIGWKTEDERWKARSTTVLVLSLSLQRPK